VTENHDGRLVDSSIDSLFTVGTGCQSNCPTPHKIAPPEADSVQMWRLVWRECYTRYAQLPTQLLVYCLRS